MEDQNESPLEVLQPSALFALERAQIDVQVATAHQYPRSIEQFKKRALSMATLDEATAEDCIYCRPVGKEKDPKTGAWKEKFAEGPSIRLAEIVGCSYGNLRVASRIVEQTPRFVKCEGVCHDLESNYAGKSEIVESTVNKEGVPYSERQRALTAKVALAKAYRDAIFKVVPRALCKPVMDAAKKIASGQGKPLEERRKKVQAWVGTLRIDEARVFAVLGVAGWSEVQDDHLLILTGIKTGIADGDRIDDVFPRLETATKSPEMPGQPKATTKRAPEPSKPFEGVNTVPDSSKPLEKAPDAENIPSGEHSDAEAEAAMGLAPATLETVPDAVAQMSPQTPVNEAPQEPDPKLAARPTDSDSLASVKLLASKSGVTYSQVMGWCEKNKLSKPGQQLSDLAESKLLNMSQKWPVILPKIREQKR